MDKTSREFAARRSWVKYPKDLGDKREGFQEGWQDCVDQVVKGKDQEIDRVALKAIELTTGLKYGSTESRKYLEKAKQITNGQERT